MVFADVINDLVMRKSSCISQIDHKTNDSCPYKREAKGD